MPNYFDKKPSLASLSSNANSTKQVNQCHPLDFSVTPNPHGFGILGLGLGLERSSPGE